MPKWGHLKTVSSNLAQKLIEVQMLMYFCQPPFWQYLVMCWASVHCRIKRAVNTACQRLLIFYSVVRMMSKFGIDVTVTLVPNWKPRFCNQSPQSLISGTSFWLYLLNLVFGWIFRLRTSGRLIVVRLSFRMTYLF